MPRGMLGTDLCSGVQCLVLNCVEHCRTGGDHLLEMEITAIKSGLLRPTHLTKGHCIVAAPANKKITGIQCK